jgi:hypothetical protein
VTIAKVAALGIRIVVRLRRGRRSLRGKKGCGGVRRGARLRAPSSFGRLLYPGLLAGSLPYEFRSPIVPSWLWITCSVLSCRARARPAETAPP